MRTWFNVHLNTKEAMNQLGLLMTYFQQESRAGRGIVRLEPHSRKMLAELISSASNQKKPRRAVQLVDHARRDSPTETFRELYSQARNQPLQDFQQPTPSRKSPPMLPESNSQQPSSQLAASTGSFLAEFSAASKREAFGKIVEHLRKSKKPEGLQKCRDILVPPVGNLDAKLVFVGEAPGADEEELGEPFVGRAGELLTKMIQAMGLDRSDVFICNVLLHRPAVGGVLSGPMSGNRPPSPEEMRAGLPQLLTFLDLVRPLVVVTLGLTAFKGLFNQYDATMSQVRGRWHQLAALSNIPVMPTYHPAYLLRNQLVSEKRKVWEDLLLVMERLDLPISEKQRGYFLPK